MAIAINPVSSLAFVTPVDALATGNNVNETTNEFNNLAAFEKILAFRSQERLAASGKLSATGGKLPAPGEPNLSDTALLNLSPQTLNVLNGVQPPVDITAAMGFQDNNAEANQAVQQQLSSIMEQFANAPFNENTFIQIQNAITAAGINPEQVSLQEVLNAFTPFSLISGEILTNDTSELLAA